MTTLQPGRQSAVGGDDPPPGQVVERLQDAADGPARSGEAGLGGDLPVGHHLALGDGGDHGDDGALVRGHGREAIGLP